MSTSRPTRSVRAATRPAPRGTPAATTRPVGAETLEPRQLLNGLSATYYDNPDLTGVSVTRIDATVNFDWKAGSPDPAIGADSFSAQWTGQVRATYSEQYTFNVQADNAARLWVNGQLLVDQWNPKTSSINASGKITLQAGSLNDVILQYREDTGNARAKLLWSSKSQVSQVIPSNNLYPPSTPAAPLAQILSEPTATINVSDFGAVGNGKTDDAPAIQHAIDALPAFGTLQLEDKTYLLNKGLLIHKPMNIEGNGGLLLLNTSSFPDNHQITISSTLSANSVKWSEPVVAGQSTFHFAAAPGTFAVGQWVFLELGQDPNDANEQHFTATVPVTAVGDDSVTLATSVPYDINAGKFNNKITPVDSLATQVHVHNIKFDNVDGTIADTAIWLSSARNTSIDGVSGRFNILLNAADSTNISLSNVTGTVTNAHSAAGRVLTAWQSNNVTVSHVYVDTSFDKPLFFVESWARNTTFEDIDVRWRYAGSPTSAVFHLTGGSTATYGDGVTIDNAGAGSVMVASSGNQASDYAFGSVTVTGGIKAASLATIGDLTWGTRHFTNATHVTKTIDLSAGWADKRVTLLTGAVKSITVSVSNAGSLSGLYVLNATGQGTSTALSTPGVATNLWMLGMIGTDYPFNDVSDSTKTLAIYTPKSIPANAKLTVDVEYYSSSR